MNAKRRLLNIFRPTAEWYNKRAIATWLPRLSTQKELLKEYRKAKRGKMNKLRSIYGNHELQGHGLECGIGSGNGLYWLSKKFPRTTFDAFDWSTALKQLLPQWRGIYGARLMDVVFCEPKQVPEMFAGCNYSWANSIDFFEHLTEQAYWECLASVYLLLKPGGYFGVHVATIRQVPHIRCRNPELVAKEIQQVGFWRVGKKLFQKPYA